MVIESDIPGPVKGGASFLWDGWLSLGERGTESGHHVPYTSAHDSIHGLHGPLW